MGRGLLSFPAAPPNATTLLGEATPRLVAPIVDVVTRVVPKIAEPVLDVATGEFSPRGDGEVYRAGPDQGAQQQAGREQAAASPSILGDQLLDFVLRNVFLFDFIVEKLIVFFDFRFASHGISSDFRRGAPRRADGTRD